MESTFAPPTTDTTGCPGWQVAIVGQCLTVVNFCRKWGSLSIE